MLQIPGSCSDDMKKGLFLNVTCDSPAHQMAKYFGITARRSGWVIIQLHLALGLVTMMQRHPM